MLKTTFVVARAQQEDAENRQSGKGGKKGDDEDIDGEKQEQNRIHFDNFRIGILST